MRGRAEVARQAHNLEVGGSNPPCATDYFNGTFRFKSLGTALRKLCSGISGQVIKDRNQER